MASTQQTAKRVAIFRYSGLADYQGDDIKAKMTYSWKDECE